MTENKGSKKRDKKMIKIFRKTENFDNIEGKKVEKLIEEIYIKEYRMERDS